MGVTISGNSIIISNANIEIINGASEEFGVAYIIITPEGGVGAIPFMATGAPGQPTLFPVITMTEIPAAEPLPTPNPNYVLLDPGGAGVPAQYSMQFFVHKGNTGLTGSPSISGASDLATAPVLNVNAEKFFLAFRFSDGKWVPTAQKVGDAYVASSIAATTYNVTSPRLLASMSVPPQPFDWRPRVFASTIVTGTGGAEPTRVNLVARLNDEASGAQLGFKKGLIGANDAGISTDIQPTYLNNQAVPGPYARVAANAAATVHLRAEQVAPSSGSWSTPASPDTTFSVEVQPLL